MTGVDYETAREWGGYLRDFPPWVDLLIAAWERALEPMTLRLDSFPSFQERRHAEPWRALSVDPIPVVLQLRRLFPTSMGRRLDIFPDGPPDFP
jgi:hypothetical protein